MRRVVPSNSVLGKALVLSFALHGVIVGVARPSVGAQRVAEALPAADRWVGTTAELPSADEGTSREHLVDVSLDARPVGPPAPATPPAPAKAPAPVAAPARSPGADPPHHTARASERRGTPARTTGGGARPSGGGSFGAEGAAGPRDLGRAFTRAIPPACTADPVWANLGAGDAGRLEVEIRIGSDGRIEGAEPRGAVRPPALVNVLRRTLPLLEAGTFALREGATTAGVEVLELSARVSEGGASDEAAPAELAFEYARGLGKARFTQSSGRRVEVSVRVVKIVAR